MAFDLGELVAYLKADASKLNQGLGDAKQDLADFGAAIPGPLKLAGAAAGAALVAGVVGAVSRDAGSDKLAAQLALDPAQQEEAGRIAGSLYANAYGDSLASVNDAVGSIISTLPGFRDASEEAVTAASQNALDFAATFDIDVARAVQSAGQLMTSGLAPDAQSAFDLITAASQQVPAALREDVLDASDEYGKFFADLGMDGPAAFGLLVKASEDGAFGIDKTGDAVKEFTIRSTDMSTASAEAYTAIGLDAEDMAAKVLAGGDTAAGGFQQVVDGLLGMEDPTARANAAIALFGTPLEDLSVTEIPAFLESLSNAEGGLEGVAGSADAMGQTLNDNAATNLESFKRQLTTAFVDTIGGQVLPKVTQLAEYLATNFGPALEATSGFIQRNQEWLAPLAVALGAAVGAILLIAGALQVWAAVQAILNIVLAANPIGIVIVLLAALVAGLMYAWQNSETFRAIVTGAWDGVKAAVSAVVSWFTTDVPAAWDAVKSKVTSSTDSAKAAVTGAWDAIKAGVSAAVAWVRNAVQVAFQAILQAIIMTNPVLFIIAHWSQIKSLIGEAASFVKSKVTEGFNAAKTAAVTAVTNLVSKVKEIPGDLASALSTLLTKGKSLGGDFVDGLKAGIAAGATKVAQAARDLAKAAWDAAKDFLGISSPSRLMRDSVGAMAGQGAADGILSKRGTITRAMEDSLADLSGVTADVPILTAGDLRVGASTASMAGVDGAPAGGGDTYHFHGFDAQTEQTARERARQMMREKELADARRLQGVSR